MTPLPRVSVVVPHYGPATKTLALLHALTGQVGVVLDVVVTDDASPEPFPAVDGVRVVRRPTNGGFGAAVNSGVELAGEALLLVLNSDVEIGPTFVRDLVAAANPWQPAVVGPLVRDVDGVPAPTGRRFPTTSHQVVEWLTPLARFHDLDLTRAAMGHDGRCGPGAVVPVDWLVGVALLLPTEVFRSVGGFDEGFFMNCEEVDLQLRLRAAGVPSVFVGTVEATHEGGGSSDPERRRSWLVDARLHYAGKWGSPTRLRAALGAATAVNALANTARRAAGRDVHPLDTARSELALLRGGRR